MNAYDNPYDIYPEMTRYFDPLGVRPHEIPSVGIFDSPTVRVCINAQWLSHLTGMMERLTYLDAWAGTEDEKYAAIDQVIKIIAELDKAENQGACDMAIVGEIRTFAFTPPPSGWLACDGATVLRADYPDLFTAIGTSYGVGDGITSFQLPATGGRNLVGYNPTANAQSQRLLGSYFGAETVVLSLTEIPAHTHTYTARTAVNFAASAPSGGQYVQGTTTPNTGSAGGGGAHNNMPPGFVAQFAIYAGA